MPNLDELYQELKSRSGGDAGDAFTESELIRQGRGTRGLDVPEEQMVPLNRYAQSYDTPLTALLSVPYEGMKYAEQKTGIPVLTGAAKAANALGVPVAPPRAEGAAKTSKASGANAMASMKGALARLKDMLTPAYLPGDTAKIKRTASSIPSDTPGSVRLIQGKAVHTPRRSNTKLTPEDIDYEK